MSATRHRPQKSNYAAASPWNSLASAVWWAKKQAEEHTQIDKSWKSQRDRVLSRMAHVPLIVGTDAGWKRMPAGAYWKEFSAAWRVYTTEGDILSAATKRWFFKTCMRIAMNKRPTQIIRAWWIDAWRAMAEGREPDWPPSAVDRETVTAEHDKARLNKTAAQELRGWKMSRVASKQGEQVAARKAEDLRRANERRALLGLPPVSA